MLQTLFSMTNDRQTQTEVTDSRPEYEHIRDRPKASMVINNLACFHILNLKVTRGSYELL